MMLKIDFKSRLLSATHLEASQPIKKPERIVDLEMKTSLKHKNSAITHLTLHWLWHTLS